ncbi:MAG: DNA polymerase III subunit beta [Firmicutes bacterium]|nr:DNA polymerase III subunit beta [Bacillota bacterium]
MKLVCNGNDLSAAVGQVIKAAASKTTNPILEGIHLKAAAGTLTLTATDLELAIEKHIRADVKIEGETVVPGRFFAEFVKKLTQEQIELSCTDSRLKIRYTDSEGTLQCLPAAEFPPVKELSDAQKFTIIRSEFKDLIHKIAFSVSLDDARPMLKGVLLEVGDVSVTGVALDGYRLAKCVKPIEKTTAMFSAVVPSRCLNEIARILDDSSDPVEISIQKNYLMVNLDHTRITTRLLDGDYINYKQIIPTNFESQVTVPREAFEQGLERAILLAKAERNNLVKFDIKDDVMRLESNSEIGNILEKIPVKISGMDITIAFNARYFTELLRYITVDHIVIKFINSVSPCIVAPSGGAEDFMYLILPVRMI